jgi:hypothetical protein
MKAKYDSLPYQRLLTTILKDLVLLGLINKEDAIKAVQKFSSLKVNDVDLQVSEYDIKVKDPKDLSGQCFFRNFPDEYSKDDIENALK